MADMNRTYKLYQLWTREMEELTPPMGGVDGDELFAGQDPRHHGGLAALRSLEILGIPVEVRCQAPLGLVRRKSSPLFLPFCQAG